MKKLLPLVIALALFVSILPIQANAAEVIASGKCGPDATWTYDSDKTLTITGTGPITMATWYMHNSDGIIKAVIGEGITTICDSAFTDREEMQEVVLPSTLKHIGYAAFYRCYGLKNLTVPASLETIDIVAFAACNIENVYVSSLEHWLSLDRSMSQMYYDNLYVNGQLVTELVYPASCPHVWYECFKGVDSLKKVTLPATVQSIGEYAFYDCNGLQEVVLPENVKHLRPYTFGACDSLTTLTIPAGVSVVADYVFTEEDSTGWSAIKSLRFAGSAPLFGANAFSQVNATVYYPANDPSWTPQVRQNYGGQINWVADASLHGGSGSQEVLASGTCGPNATWSISSTGVLTISGTGKATDNPWCEDYQSVIRQLKVNEGITDLGESLFYGATSLYYAELPNSLLTIGDVCFKDCTSLKEIILPNNIHTIESQAFMASALEKVHLPNKLQELSDNLFLDCLSLKEITIPASVKKVGHMVFSVGWADADIIRSMDQIRFLGDAPEFSDSAFANLRATVLVPEGNPTWTSDVKNNYGGWITWGYGQGHYYESEVTPPPVRPAATPPIPAAAVVTAT